MFKKMMFLFLIAGLVFSCQKSEEKKEERAVPVNVLVLKPDSIRSVVEITGNLEAVNDALVISKVSEQLKEIVKPVGSKVSAGEVIVKLDDCLLLQAKKQAEAVFNSALARYKNVKQDFERYQRLFEQKAISQQQWEKMKSAMQEAEAGLAQAKAALGQASEQFENTTLKAPFAGIVGSIFYERGQLAPMGQPVVKIINPQFMKAKLYLPDLYFQKIKMGQKVRAYFPAIKNKTFTGKVIKIDPAIDPMSRTFTVEALFNNQAGLLTSGLYGLFEIELKVHKNVVVIPDNAVLSQTSVRVDPETGKPHAEREYFVFSVKNGKAVLKQIESGLNAGDRLEIKKGLAFGDSVIVVGQRLLKEGQKVKIVEAY